LLNHERKNYLNEFNEIKEDDLDAKTNQKEEKTERKSNNGDEESSSSKKKIVKNFDKKKNNKGTPKKGNFYFFSFSQVLESKKRKADNSLKRWRN